MKHEVLGALRPTAGNTVGPTTRFSVRYVTNLAGLRGGGGLLGLDALLLGRAQPVCLRGVVRRRRRLRLRLFPRES
jgi:hypothetical protein